MPSKPIAKTQKQLVDENKELRERLDEAEETLKAISRGDVDAFVVPGVGGDRLYTLKGADHSYRLLIEDMSEGALTLTLDGVISYANRRFAEMLRAPLEKVIGSTIHTWIAADNQEILRSLLGKNAGEKRREELLFTASDGTHVPVYLSVSNVSMSGMPDSYCLVATDLTEQKRLDGVVAAEKLARESLAAAAESRRALLSVIEDQQKAEEALRISDQKNKALLNANPDLMFRIRRDGVFMDYRARSTSDLYVSPDKILGGNMRELMPPAFTKQVLAQIRTTLKTGDVNNFEFALTLPAGLRHYEARMAPSGVEEVVCLVRDITERKLAEESLRKSEIQYRALFDGVLDGIYRTTHDGRFVDMNDAMVKMFGYSSKEEMLQIDIAKHLYFADGDRDSHFLDTDTETIEIFRMRTKNGSEIWVEDHGQYVHDEQGNIIFHEGTLRDVTERQHAEEARRHSEERYRELVENSLDIIYTSDLEGNYTSANKAVEKITGYTVEETVTKNLALTVVPEDIENVRQRMAELIAGKTAIVYGVEVFARDGHRVALEVNARLIKENGVPVGIQGVARDITERKQLEDQFRQSQKMEAVGQLAGGVAHDFNNLLTVINGYSDLTLRRMPPDDRFRDNIQEIRKAGERAAELTDQLLIFSRKTILQPRVLNLNSVIVEIDGMLRRLIRENIEYLTVLDPGLGNIKGDPGQIGQVIINLAVNARDAMPDGGILTIKTENVHFDEDHVGMILAVSPGPFVKLTVTDTGEGMDAKTMDRIFEPFFTTKPVGKGTGLGLSTVHGIVKQLGGDIALHSEKGRGTTFEVYLSCIAESVERPKWIADEEANYSGTETILLVEDEEIVRKFALEVLTSNGYHVLEADCGKAALSICDAYSGPIHMMLTDVIMPRMSGIELKDLVVKLHPEIKTLFMSGYTDDALTYDGILDSDTAFIEKPFTYDALSKRVREVLGS